MFRLSPKLIASAIIGLGLAGQSRAQGSTLVLEEVLVTAQKRTESLKDIPKTVNVVSGEQVEAFAAFSFEELSTLTAGLAIYGTANDTDIATRGLGTDLDAAVAPRVSVYLDGAHIAAERGLFTGMYDLRRLELLRGPQGTLYGLPSPAGTITIQSRGPNLEQVDGYMQQSFSSHKGSNTQLGISLPLKTNTLGVRVSGLYDTNALSDAQNITLGKDLEYQTRSFRIVTFWTPSDNFDLRLAYHDIADGFDVDPVVKGNGIAFDDRIALADFDSRMKGESDYTILEMNYTFANDWTTTLVGSKQDNVLTVTMDGDGSSVQSREQLVTSDLSDLYNIELRLASLANDSWAWIFGAFYEYADIETSISTDTYLAAAPGFTILARTTGIGFQNIQSYGVFTHNIIQLAHSSALTVGLRYNALNHSIDQPFTSDIYRVQPDDSLALLRSQSLQGVLPEDQESETGALTGTLTYQYDFADDYMAYASYERGWRAGSANLAGGLSPPQFAVIDAETSDSLEVGFKLQFLGGRGLFNVATYYQRYSNFQYQAESVEFRDPQGRIGLTSPVVNVDEAVSYGVDSDVAVLLSENWRLSGALSYNRAELSQAEDVPCTNGEPISDQLWDFNSCDLSGERAGNQPVWSANLATEYHRSLFGGISEWYLRGLVNAESRYYSANEQADLDSYATIDLFLGLRGNAVSWNAMLWVKNVFDQSAELKTERLPAIADFEHGGAMESGLTWVKRQLNPRTVGVTLSYTF